MQSNSIPTSTANLSRDHSILIYKWPNYLFDYPPNRIARIHTFLSHWFFGGNYLLILFRKRFGIQRPYSLSEVVFQTFATFLYVFFRRNFCGTCMIRKLNYTLMKTYMKTITWICLSNGILKELNGILFDVLKDGKVIYIISVLKFFFKKKKKTFFFFFSQVWTVCFINFLGLRFFFFFFFFFLLFIIFFFFFDISDDFFNLLFLFLFHEITWS